MKQNQLKPMAANIDHLYIVAALQPAYSLQQIDSYLVAAEALHIHPVIVINKMDCQDSLSHDEQGDLLELIQCYRRLNYPVITTSTTDPSAITPLIAHIDGYTSVFVGQSGVGKSSIVQLLLPQESIAIGPLSEKSGHGTHTTSTARLYHFNDHTHIIDAPGIRDFALWHMTPGDIAQGFVDFKPYLGHCKFRDCRHNQEPGCAIIQRVKEGSIAKRRWTSYCRLINKPKGQS